MLSCSGSQAQGLNFADGSFGGISLVAAQGDLPVRWCPLQNALTRSIGEHREAGSKDDHRVAQDTTLRILLGNLSATVRRERPTPQRTRNSSMRE